MPKTPGGTRRRGGRGRGHAQRQPAATRRSARTTTRASTTSSMSATRQQDSTTSPNAAHTTTGTETTPPPSLPLAELLELIQTQVQTALQAQQAAIPSHEQPLRLASPSGMIVLILRASVLIGILTLGYSKLYYHAAMQLLPQTIWLRERYYIKCYV